MSDSEKIYFNKSFMLFVNVIFQKSPKIIFKICFLPKISFLFQNLYKRITLCLSLLKIGEKIVIHKFEI